MPTIWGHDAIKKRLENACDSGEISHAYIFEGPKGIGKYTVAMHFAMYMLCSGKKQRPCGVCASCRKALGGNHEHIYCIEPEGNSVKDAQVEEIQRLIMKKSYDDHRTFIIADGAQTMTARAQNRILKTLEDPPQKITFVLLAENAQSMAMTILSRCIVISFKPLARNEILQMMMEKNATKRQAELIAALCFGLPGKAVEMLSADGLDEKRKSAIGLAFKLLHRMPYYRSGTDAAELAGNKEEAIETLDIMQGLFRDVLLIQAGGSRETIMNVDYFEEMSRVSAKVSRVRIFSLIRAVQMARNDIALNINVNYSFKNMLLCE